MLDILSQPEEIRMDFLLKGKRKTKGLNTEVFIVSLFRL